MKEGFRQCMAWLHTWSGLVVGWVLFFIFVTGTAGYFYTDIDRWMRPELPPPAATVATADALRMAQAHLQAKAPVASSWGISLPGTRDNPHLSVTWQPVSPPDSKERPERVTEVIDVTTGTAAHAVEPRETGGGFLLYRMHWRLHYMPSLAGEWIVGICSMFMLVALISGIITHKKIFKDFFTFRPGKGQRSWLDFHNVSSVMALPFFLMITYSGLVFLMYTYMPAGVVSTYGVGNQDAFFKEAFPRLREKPSGEPAVVTDLLPLLQQVEQQWGRDQIDSVFVRNPGDANASIGFRPREGGSVRSSDDLRFKGVSGEPVIADDQGSAARATRDVMLALHEGHFAGIALRWAYFLSGLMGTVMIATGLVLWTVKRRPQHIKRGQASFGHNLVERLNIGTIVGLPMGVAVYFWANRLIPADLAGRENWEVHALFLAWAAALIYPAFRPVMQAWVEMLWLAAATYMLLPLVNALTTHRHLGTTLPQGDWGMAGVDLTLFALGLLFAYGAVRVRRKLRAVPVKRPARQAAGRQPVSGAAAEMI